MTSGSQVDKNVDVIFHVVNRLMSVEFTNEEIFNDLYELILSQNVELPKNASSSLR